MMRWLKVGTGFALVALLAGCGGKTVQPRPCPPGTAGPFEPLCSVIPPCPPEKVCPPEKECPPPPICQPCAPCVPCAECPPPQEPPKTCADITCPPDQACVQLEGAAPACIPIPPTAQTCADVTCAPGENCVMEGDPPAPVCKAQEPPPTLSCNDDFIPDSTGWNVHTIKDGQGKGKVVCGKGGCGKPPYLTGNVEKGTATYYVELAWHLFIDSTTRHKGKVPNWKTCQTPSVKACVGIPDCHGDPLELWPVCPEGRVERSEYPPAPAVGHDCNGGPTTARATGPIKLTADGPFGWKVTFTGRGSGTITVCRSDNTHCTTKAIEIK